MDASDAGLLGDEVHPSITKPAPITICSFQPVKRWELLLNLHMETEVRRCKAIQIQKLQQTVY